MIGAGILYFATMFALGFAFGTFRTLVLEPWLGPVNAVLVEAVPMIAAMVVVAPWAARLFDVPGEVAPRFGMGFVALVLLALAETGLDLLLRGQVMWARRLHTTDGLIGYALLLIFAAMPVWRRRAE